MFFNYYHKDKTTAYGSMLLHFDVGIFNDVGLTAKIIKQERAFALLPIMRSVDNEVVDDIEKHLRGITSNPSR
ncbi:hypothetical protein A8F94_24595 [Bacillus sp. FJAT-27225]|nr:hypothetical protein A8F94_24595 [Bacillus sp. FJAT-27225]